MHLDSQMFRSLLIAEVLINGNKFALCTTHLEAQTENKQLRAQQLKSIQEALKDYQNVILAGDFNISDHAELEGFETEYQEAWSSLVDEK